MIHENGLDPFAPIGDCNSGEWAQLILGQPAGSIDLLDVPLTSGGTEKIPGTYRPAQGYRAARDQRPAIKIEGDGRPDDEDDGTNWDDGDAMQDDDLGARGNLNRGKYRCGRCGQYKVNHQCPFVVDRSSRTVSAQADPMQPIITAGAITIAVSRRSS